MIRYETLEQLAASCGIRISLRILREEDALDGLFVRLKGGGSLILINRHRPLPVRIAALAEELGHYFRSIGDLRDLSDIFAAKSEALAHAWSIERLLPQPVLQAQLENGSSAAWEVAEATDLPEPFVREAAAYHSRKAGRNGNGKTLPPDLQEAIQRAVERSRDKKEERIFSPAPVPPPPPAPRPARIRPVKAAAPPREEPESLRLSDTLRQDAERLFGLKADDPRWDAILYAMLLTDCREIEPTKPVTRTYYFPPVKVRRGVMYRMTGSFIRDELEQWSFLYPFGRRR